MNVNTPEEIKQKLEEAAQLASVLEEQVSDLKRAYALQQLFPAGAYAPPPVSGRATWSYDARREILALLMQHTNVAPITGEDFHDKLKALSPLGENLTLTHVRSVSYRLIKEASASGIPAAANLDVPSFAFDATVEFDRMQGTCPAQLELDFGENA